MLFCFIPPHSRWVSDSGLFSVWAPWWLLFSIGASTRFFLLSSFVLKSFFPSQKIFSFFTTVYSFFSGDGKGRWRPGILRSTGIAAFYSGFPDFLNILIDRSHVFKLAYCNQSLYCLFKKQNEAVGSSRLCTVCHMPGKPKTCQFICQVQTCHKHLHLHKLHKHLDLQTQTFVGMSLFKTCLANKSAGGGEGPALGTLSACLYLQVCLVYLYFDKGVSGSYMCNLISNRSNTR